MSEKNKGFPVHVETQVQSATHASLEIDCQPLFAVRRDEQNWLFVADVSVHEAEVLLDTWRVVDSYLAAMSIIAEGVFARTAWTARGALAGIKFPAGRPRDLWAVGGLTVMAHQEVDQSNASAILKFASRLRRRVETDEGAFAALTMYSAASWFLSANLIREAALNYFAAVETIASELSPGVRKKAVYQWGDIARAVRPLALASSELAVLHEGYRQRGESAHGKASQLILAQHSIGVYPATSYSLKVPALACKAAADVIFQSYFQ